MRPIWPLVAALALAQSAPLPQTPPRDRPRSPSGHASISGRVVAADTGAPLPDAVVLLSAARDPGERPEPANFGRLTAQTDDEGHYAFTGLPAGRYTFAVAPPPLRAMYIPLGLSFHRDDRPTRIELAEGESRENVDIPLARGGVLAGRVLDESDLPLSGIRVQALARTDLREEPILAARPQETDDDGRYRLYGLPPGDYYIRTESPPLGASVQSGADEPESFVPTFYPGTTNPNEAPLVPVRPGEVVEALDIRLIRTRSYRISGVVLDSLGRPAPGADISISYDRGSSSHNLGLPARADGTFSFDGLVPGDYRLSARSRAAGAGPADEGVAGVLVTLSTANVENLTLAMHGGVTVRGRVVTIAGTPPPFAPSGVRVHAMSPDVNDTLVAQPDADWRFALEGVLAPAVVSLQGSLPRGWFVDSVVHRGRNVTDEPIDLSSDPSGRELQLVISDRPARLTGVVTGDEGRPHPLAAVLLFPVDFERLPRYNNRIRVAIANDDGVYALEPLAAGEYLIVAVDSPLPLSGGGPSSLAMVAPNATRVTLAEGEQRAVDLRLTVVRKD